MREKERQTTTQHPWNSSTERETIHAIRDIKKEEEITISYNLGGPSQSRIQQLKRSYGLYSNGKEVFVRFVRFY
jgi:hypothetical protein